MQGRIAVASASSRTAWGVEAGYGSASPEQVDFMRRVKWLLDQGMTLWGAVAKAGCLATLEQERVTEPAAPMPERRPGEMPPEPWDAV